MDVDLYPLPASLKPCEYDDRSDTRYLNQSYYPIVNPLRKVLNIDLYNKTWFDKPLRTFKPLFKYDHLALAFPEYPSTPFPSVSELNDDSQTPCVPP